MLTSTKGAYRITATPHDPINPREVGGNIGKMICWHSRYRLGDSHDFDRPLNFYESIRQDVANGLPEPVMLPLYLLDHSGLCMSTTPFNNTWDSGQIGYIYIDGETLKRKYGAYLDREKLEDRLRREVAMYDYYLMGETVYTITVYEGNSMLYGLSFNATASTMGELKAKMRTELPHEFWSLVDGLHEETYLSDDCAI